MSALQGLQDSDRLTQDVFEPLCFDKALVDTCVGNCNLSRSHVHVEWKLVWNACACFDAMLVWFPPPEIARQVIVFMLETWAERPLTSSSLFFIPRTVPAFWWGLSRQIVKLPTVCPHLTPLQRQPLLPLPIVVLHSPPHVRALSAKDRLARTAAPANAVWHQEQAALLRGLPPEPVE
jgi:hypothetical protein